MDNCTEKILKGLADICNTVKEDIGFNHVIGHCSDPRKSKTVWKPTKAQIDALTHFVRSIGESGYASPYDDNIKLLYSLLNDLEEQSTRDITSYSSSLSFSIAENEKRDFIGDGFIICCTDFQDFKEGVRNSQF